MFDFFNSKSKTITNAAIILAFSSVISAFLGIFRDRLLAGIYGAGSNLDVYFAAFRVPDFVYGVLITGGLTAAFLPVFSETFEKDKKEGWDLVNNLFNFLVLTLSGLSFLLFIFAPLVVKIIAPGFDSAQTELTIILTRIMLLSPILLGISNLFSGVLKYFDNFLTYALAPILYNVGIIFGIFFLVPKYDLIGLAYGVLIGALAHMLIQIPAIKRAGFKYSFFWDVSSKKLKKIVSLIVPRIVGQTSMQINLVFITAIASTLTVGTLSIFNFANHLHAFPVRVIGISFAVAAFPKFSKSLSNGKMNEFLDSFSSSTRRILFAIIPLSFLIFILRGQIVRLALGTGEFGWTDTRLTAAALGIFSFSLFCNCLMHLLIRAYFSFQDTKTPVYVSIIGVLINIGLILIFVFLLQNPGLFRDSLVYFLRLESLKNIEVLAFPLAFFFSTFFQFVALFYILEKRIRNLRRAEIIDSAIRILGSSLFMIIVAFFTLRVMLYFVTLDTFWGVFIQSSVTVLVSVLVYFVSAHFFKLPEVKIILRKFL